MDTLALDYFTQEIARFHARAQIEVDPVKRTSFLGVARRLEKKRDNLSFLLFQRPYKEAVDSGKYESWIS